MRLEGYRERYYGVSGNLPGWTKSTSRLSRENRFTRALACRRKVIGTSAAGIWTGPPILPVSPTRPLLPGEGALD